MVAYEVDVCYTASDNKEEEFTHVVNAEDREDAEALTREHFADEYPEVTDLKIKEVREVNRG